MKIDLSKLKIGKSVIFKESLDVLKFYDRLSYPLDKIINLNADAEVTDYSDFIAVNITINSDVLLVCSYTLEKFQEHIKDHISLQFSSNKEDENSEEDIIYFKGNEINLDPYIIDLLFASIPTRPIKKGAKLPKCGENYEVYTEDKYLESEKNKTDSRFDKLLDIDLDE